MLYSMEEDTGADGQKFAFLKCEKCKYKEPITRENPIVYEHSLREDRSTRLAVNPYLKYDPTLPRFHTIVCPNTECPTRSGKAKPDVVGIRNDAANVIWQYVCAVCDITWKQSAAAS